MGLGAVGPGAIEWAVTYAIHSTVLLGVVALATHGPVRSDAWRETLWRGALVGSVLTATLAQVVPFAPLAGRWALPGAGSRPAIAAARAADGGGTTTTGASGGPVASPAGGADRGPTVRGGGAGESPSAGGAERDPATRGERTDESPTAGGAIEDGGRSSGAATGGGADRAGASDPDAGRSATGDWSAALLLTWLVIAGSLLALLARRNRRVFRRLRDRERLTRGPLVAMLAELRRLGGVWTPVRLSVSPSCPTPLVIGASEICLPPRFVDGLDGEQQRAALAHELAHVARRDPYWQLGAAIVNALLFFQPLNHLARLRLRETAEHLCDDWAVRRTGSPLALGRCLTEIASWSSPDPLPHLHATSAMAEGGSPLLRRVRRIAGGIAVAPQPRARPLAATALLLVATIAVAPVVAGGPEPADGTPEPIEASRGDGRMGPLLADDPSAPSTSLAERWRDAVASSSDHAFWIGWGIDRPPSSGRGMVISSTPGPAGRDGPGLTEALRSAGIADAPDVAFLFGFDSETPADSDVAWMMIRSADAPTDLAGLPLHWLGDAPHDESVAQLRWLFTRTPLAEVQAEIMAAYTLHSPGPATHAAIAASLGGAPDEDVRAEATDWLANQDTPDDVALLESIAMEDPSPNIRRDAASGLAEFTDPAAVQALLRIARRATDPRVRSEAVQQLDEQRSDDVVAALIAVAFQDSVAAVRLEAVDVLVDLPLDSARAGLRRLAREHPDPVVRSEAVDALSDPPPVG